MSIFDQIKDEFRAKYPDIKTLGILERISVKLNGKRSFVSRTVETDRGTFTQWAVLVSYKSKDYLLRFKGPNSLT